MLEGSNNRQKWIIIDTKKNNYDLNGPYKEHYYPISPTTDEFQYIRLRAIGKCHWADHVGCNFYFLVFSKIELFGEIKCPAILSFLE